MQRRNEMAALLARRERQGLTLRDEGNEGRCEVPEEFGSGEWVARAFPGLYGRQFGQDENEIGKWTLGYTGD